MAKYLITGVAGFIGSSLAHKLIERGQTVRGIDNFVTGQRKNLKEIAAWMEFREADLRDADAARAACEGMDYVLHDAAIASVPRSVADPLTTHGHNVDATLNVLLAAREAGVKRIVYAASSSAYGDAPELPKREEMAPKPISPYAVSKLTGELYMQCFWRTYGLETVSLRYFNVFGPRQDAQSPYSGVLAKFITSVLQGEQPTIYGDGEQSRDFTYIDNVVDANLLACAAPGSQVAGEVFNVATGNRITLNYVLHMLKSLSGYTGEAKFGPPRAGDIRDSVGDISRARRHLGYEPKGELEEGLRKTLEWYRHELAATSAVAARPAE